MYRMKKDTVFIILLFIAIMLVTVWFSGCSAYVPYTETIASRHAAYEGFHQRIIPLEYGNIESPASSDDTYLNFSINGSNQDCKKVSGFDGQGVFCNPQSKYGDKLDIYSELDGSLQCGGNGYNNSRGGLCLKDKHIQQLRTRGGNAAGAPSTIAGASA
jgi:hypothetical protein